MDFESLPPEINSWRMYLGPGAGSMMEAASAWGRLAARLCVAVADCRAATLKPAATAEAVAPYITWLDAVATQTRRAATQATAAARAHQSALAATVPPPAIDANRAQRRSLTTQNYLGQTGPAIADIDAEYERMWAQDADAMHAYARASAEAATLTPFTSPPGNRDAAGTWALQSAPDIVSTGHDVMSTISEALQRLCPSPLASLDASLLSVASPLSRLSSLSAPSDFAIKHLNSLNKEAALRSLFTRPDRAGRPAPTGCLGRRASIGQLSVPRAWATATAPATVYRESLRRGG